MATNWTTIVHDMIAAVEGVLGKAWPTAANGAIAGVKALSTIAQEIESSQDLAFDEKKQLMSEYKQSLKNTLTAYESISAAIAQNAVNAAVTVLIKAAPALAGFV
jgi:hypothetical protein